MTMLDLLIGGSLILSAVVMLILWLVYLRIDNLGLVDVGWALTLALIAVYDAIMAHGYASRRHMVAAVVGFWGVRKAMHLLGERVLGKPEESRYQRLKAQWKDHPRIQSFFLFQAQALLCVLLSLPFLFLCLDTYHHIRKAEWAGIGLWAIALIGESIPNPWQKAFQWLLWVGYFVMASGAPHGQWSIVAPLLMLAFLQPWHSS